MLSFSNCSLLSGAIEEESNLTLVWHRKILCTPTDDSHVFVCVSLNVLVIVQHGLLYVCNHCEHR